MNAIDDLLDKRRKAAAGDAPGERRSFSVDRARAIAKMRRFALENPQYYLLELVQAAIANDAGFIDIDLFRLRRDLDDLKFRWEGHGFTGLELTRLFDFLFMSEDEPGCADTILLARGVNAMLHFEPEVITITAGDGTLEHTYRVEVRPHEPAPRPVEVREPLTGVFIHAEQLYCSLMPPNPGQMLGDREVALLSDKCIAPEVRVMLNGRFISDWHSGYDQQLEWDSDYVEIAEDDLYGRLWKPPEHQPSFFDVMTWGVKIERVDFGGPLAGLSGAVNFNRLNKTADHARIVRDEIFAELEARLRPYADQLRHGGEAATFAIRNLAGKRYGSADLVEIVREARRIVVVDPAVLREDDMLDAARRIGAALDSPILAASGDDLQTLRMLVGSSCELLVPRLGRERDVAALSAPAAPPVPARWHLARSSLEPMAVRTFVGLLAEEYELDESAENTVTEALGSTGQIVVRAYRDDAMDEDEPGAQRRWVSLLVCDRVVWDKQLAVVLPGHHLRCHLPATSPSALDRPVETTGGLPTIARLCAQMAVRLARRAIDSLGRRAAEALEAARSATELLVEYRVEDDGLRGVIGLSAQPSGRASVALVERLTGRVEQLEQVGEAVEVAGWLVVDEELFGGAERIDDMLPAHVEALLERAIAAAARTDDARTRRRATKALLDFAAAHLRIERDRDGRGRWRIDDPLAERILGLPLFPTTRGVAVSGLWMVRWICAGEAPPALAEDAEPFLAPWLAALESSAPRRLRNGR